MSMDLTGINNYNEYYTNHYFSSVFEDNAEETISEWRRRAKESEEIQKPWSLLRECSKQFYGIRDRYLRSRNDILVLSMIQEMADSYIDALGFSEPNPLSVEINENSTAPVYLEVKKHNGEPLLWIMLANTQERDDNIIDGYCFDSRTISEDYISEISKTSVSNEELLSSILFSMTEPPRWIILIGISQIALIDRNKWNEKRYLQFELEEIFSRREESTLQAMAVLLHKESLCPEDGNSLLDKLDENSHRHAAGVSQDLKYALRESIELLGNEVLYDMKHRLGRNMDSEPVNAAQLTLECLRYMYRMLFILFIEARPELGYAPMKSQAYVQGYSFESLRDISEKVREETSEVGDGYYLHETLSKLFELVYTGYPENETTLKELIGQDSLHDIFVMEPLKAHIFDPEYTDMITNSKIRNCIMLKIIDLMSISRPTGRRNERRGRISYASLGINQMGAVYEALLSYRGFIAEETLFEVKREKDSFNELDVGYFVTENELDNYSEDERVRYTTGENEGRLRKYEKGTFIYRLAGREREKSASYYTPEVLTKCLVKYALKELLEGKTADEILQLTVCEPAMGSAAFLNEAINQLAESYLDKKQKELGETISYENRYQELQRVKMYIADRNVYGVDLNPVAVELAEVSLWLNTIYKGAFVPWFGMQLVNGNSLIGARKQCYRIEQLNASRAPGRWYDNAPERIMPGSKRMPKKQVYHFLMGDPGMANYSDKVIKSLVPDVIQKIKDWNRNFTSAYNDDDIETLLRLSAIIDDLWEKQVELRKTVNEQTTDTFSVYGHEEIDISSHTTIREKDMIYKRLYKSEEMKNAGPYARLKLAMDYWCSLWFWPIEMVDMLPTRSEFLFEMSLILEGGIVSVTTKKGRQLSMFSSEIDEMANEVFELYKDLPEVDIAALYERNDRLKLVQKITSANKFMHWELEFADLFKEHGGFDLVIGNPPWIKIEWNEQAVLSDKQPLLVVKSYSANQAIRVREKILEDTDAMRLYFEGYIESVGIQNFLNAKQNYADLKGVQTNLYKCFLPQAWMIGAIEGISAFIHPEGVYDDPKGGKLRKKIYPKLLQHYHFINEKMLFADVGHPTVFSLNIYCNRDDRSKIAFNSISNLFDPITIDQCYESDGEGYPEGIKDVNNKWSIKGHRDRILEIKKEDLKIFAKIFDEEIDFTETRLLGLHTKQLLATIQRFGESNQYIRDINVFASEMWHETYSQNDGTIYRQTRNCEVSNELICSGPHIAVSNPYAKTPRRVCVEKGDYDVISLNDISEDYLPRTNYYPNVSFEEYIKRSPTSNWGGKYISAYRLVSRKMLNLKQERTMNCAIIPPGTAHINGLIGFMFEDVSDMLYSCGLWSSLPYDYLIKIIGKANYNLDSAAGLPLPKGRYRKGICFRALKLNCISKSYFELLKKCWDSTFQNELWAKNDIRLDNNMFRSMTDVWTWEFPLRNEFQRRQALVELDVLTAMALGMTLEQLKIIYRIQFPVLQLYESDTWYDQNGRIIFTNNRSLTGVGYSRAEWNEIKDAKSGIFKRTIIDDTQPGGPVERIIEYEAPFDRCDREQDYETAWKHFEERFKEN